MTPGIISNIKFQISSCHGLHVLHVVHTPLFSTLLYMYIIVYLWGNMSFRVYAGDLAVIESGIVILKYVLGYTCTSVNLNINFEALIKLQQT